MRSLLLHIATFFLLPVGSRCAFVAVPSSGNSISLIVTTARSALRAITIPKDIKRDDNDNDNNNNDDDGGMVLLSRRNALAKTFAVVAATTTALSSSPLQPASAATSTIISNELEERRNALLSAISSNAPESTVAQLIDALEPYDPSQKNGAAASELGGSWELIYSINADAFSPLLGLPRLIRPKSYQLLGDDAAKEVGVGRVAQVLDFPGGFFPVDLVLSSGAVPVVGEEKQSSSDVLEIYPPFRFEAVWGDDNLRKKFSDKRSNISSSFGTRAKLVESGTDADFRALNARDGKAQAAGRNMYKQRYLEVTGTKGDLRISEVVSGDPVIVGCVFVHRRL